MDQMMGPVLVASVVEWIDILVKEVKRENVITEREMRREFNGKLSAAVSDRVQSSIWWARCKYTYLLHYGQRGSFALLGFFYCV